MKKTLFLSIGIVFLYGCVGKIHHIKLAPLVSFTECESEKIIPVDVVLYLSKEFKEEMPFTDDDEEIWPWFFVEGAKSIFKDVTTIEDLKAIDKSPEITLVIKPELWVWFFDIYFDYYCRVGFKFRFFNKAGSEKLVFLAEGNGNNRDRMTALAHAMDALMREFREEVKARRGEILSIQNESR